MNAAAAEDEDNAERGTGAPAPALVLVRTRKEPCVAGSPSRAGNASRHDEVLEDHLTGRPGPVGPVGQAMTAMDVRVALAQLRPEHRQVIVEMLYLGRSVTEIAQLRSIPEGTVTSRGYTWLSEDEQVWGTEPALGPAVLGRDLADEEDFDSYDEFDEPAQQPARDRAPIRGREL